MLGAVAGASLRAAAQQEIRTAFIGVGRRGRSLVEQVLAERDVKITAICDIEAQARDQAQSLAKRDNPRSMTDYRRVLELKDVDAVVVATPCYLHAEMATACLEAFKYVYCEKPLGITPEQVELVLRAARQSKAFLQIGQQLRYMPGLREMIRLLHQDKVLGEAWVIKAQRHGTPVPAEAEQSRPAWYKDVKLSGDLIVENAVHNLDVCNWAIGSLPERAAGFGGTLVWVNDPPGRTNMDGYTLCYEYANGVKMSFTQVFFHPNGMPGGGQYFYVYGTEGAVDVNGGMYYPRARKSQPVRLIELEVPRGRDAHIAAFFESIRTGAKPPADYTVAATGALTAILGREAIYRKKMMTWKDLGVEI